MTDQKERPREINLDCGHSLWLKAPYPNIGETLWCSKCGRYEFVGPMHELQQTVYHDTWKSWRRGRLYVGECLEEGCAISHKGVNFYTVRGKMELHHIREHVKSTLIFRDPIQLPHTPVTPDTPPPF